MKKLALTLFLIIGGLSMLFMSVRYFGDGMVGIAKGKAIAEHLWYRLCLQTHIAGGLLAILIGPWQLLPRFRAKQPKVHRLLGYVYVGSVLASGATGLVVAPFAMGGLITQVGFSLLAIVWLTTTLLAVRAVLQKNWPRHGVYMQLSYALTFGAITQRTLLLVPLLTDVPFMPIYQLSAWLPWLLNLALVWWVQSQQRRRAWSH